MRTRLIEQLIRHEGLKLKPYKCTKGILTIGVGLNLEDRGITKEEALYLLQNCIGEVETQCKSSFHWYHSLDTVRQDVILNMVFNLGINRFRGFKKFINYIIAKNYKLASEEMLDSEWAKQVGSRAIELSNLMRFGESIPMEKMN